ncbi:hypothetical protein ACLB2K_025951 [Fragaria x ananassa]
MRLESGLCVFCFNWEAETKLLERWRFDWVEGFNKVEGVNSFTKGLGVFVEIQVFQTFKEFHAMVERETRRTLKCLRSDNGGEYTSNEFRGYCSKHDIRHIKTVPSTPQHNGVAQRMNRTILEKVRSMLKTANLAKEFWGAAVKTACYLINRTPCVPLGLETPESVWTSRSASYSHLKVFGCKAFAHVLKEKRSKLDDKAVPCIFLGYGNEEMGYRLWNPITKKLFISRDVVFHKDQTIANFDKNILENAEHLTYNSSPLQEESNKPQEMVNEDVPDMAEPEAAFMGEAMSGRRFGCPERIKYQYFSVRFAAYLKDMLSEGSDRKVSVLIELEDAIALVCKSFTNNSRSVPYIRRLRRMRPPDNSTKLCITANWTSP